MSTPITVNYTRHGEDWRLTAVRAEKELTAQAPGLIAARDKADQLIEQLAPEEEKKTVVHLIDGDAFAFSEAYLYARHGNGKPPAPSNGAPAKPAAQAAPPAQEPAPEVAARLTGS